MFRHRTDNHPRRRSATVFHAIGMAQNNADDGTRAEKNAA
jgi:hypothetical protein